MRLLPPADVGSFPGSVSKISAGLSKMLSEMTCEPADRCLGSRRVAQSRSLDRLVDASLLARTTATSLGLWTTIAKNRATKMKGNSRAHFGALQRCSQPTLGQPALVWPDR